MNNQKYLSDNELIYIHSYCNNAVKHYNSKNLECEIRNGILGKQNDNINRYKLNRIINFYENLLNDKLADIKITKEDTDSISLDINLTSNKIKESLNNLRFTLKEGSIKEYCSTDVLPKNTKTMYKAPFDWKNRDDDDITRNTNLTDSGYNFLKRNTCRIGLDNIRARIGGKLELILSKERGSTQFKLDNIDNPDFAQYLTEASETYNHFIKEDFKDLYKTYRLKKRNSFKIIYNNTEFWIDLTRVKESKKAYNKNMHDYLVPTKLFIDSEIIEQNEKYEYELEFNPVFLNKEYNKKDVENRTLILKENVLFVLYNIFIPSMNYANEYPIYTTLSEETDILEIYKQTVKNMFSARIQKKRKVLSDLLDLKNKDTSPAHKIVIEDTYSASSNYSFFELMKNKSIEEIQSEKQKVDSFQKPYNLTDFQYFISPKVVSIEMNDIRQENEMSICSEYSVTDKADGLSMLLFKVGLKNIDDKKYSEYKNRLYFIDSNLQVYSTNLKCSLNNDMSHIFNGEYLPYNKEGQPIKKYGIFDTFVYDSEDTCYHKLLSINEDEKTRIKFAQDYFKNKLEKQYTDLPIIDIFIKDFKISENNGDIFTKSNEIWEKMKTGQFEYKLDGLIYTPLNYPVGYNKRHDYDMKPSNTWFSNLKWKPSEDNTIDFLLKFDKKIEHSYNGKTIYKDNTKYISYTNESDKGFREYKIAKLYNGGLEGIQTNPCFPINKAPRQQSIYKPIPFKPTNNREENIEYIYLPINNGLVKDINGEIIDDDTIVEVSYSKFNPSRPDYEIETNLRWSILRTRHDKTLEYKNGLENKKMLFEHFKKCSSIISSQRSTVNYEIFNNKKTSKLLKDAGILEKNVDNYLLFKKNIELLKNKYTHYLDIHSNIKFGNDYRVANNIWDTIHNPITIDMITTGKNIPTVNEQEEKYYNRDILSDRSKSLTLPMQNFHNKIIKNKILLSNVVKQLRLSGVNKISLLDLACGKGGDIAKWRDNEISKCVGIDNVSNNILDSNDGACQRLEFYKKNSNKNLPEIYFLIGDVAKNIKNDDAFTDSRFKNLFRNLWLPHSTYDTNFGTNKFDIISIMFAIHYFFDTKENLDMLVTNIDENLKKGGYLIGTCFDGDKIFKLLEDIPFKQEKSGFKGGNKIWKIIKDYNEVEFPKNDLSIGMKIRVLISSIGKIIPEWLVNFDYLSQKLAEKGIKKLSSDEIEKMNLPSSESIGSFKEVFDTLKNVKKEENIYPIANDIANNLTQTEKDLSFLFSYFIFKKDTEEDENIIEVNKYLLTNIQKYEKFLKGNKLEQIINQVRQDLPNIQYTDAVLEKASKIFLQNFKAELIKLPQKKKLVLKKKVVSKTTEKSVSDDTSTKNEPNITEKEFELFQKRSEKWFKLTTKSPSDLTKLIKTGKAIISNYKNWSKNTIIKEYLDKINKKINELEKAE